MLRLVTLFLCFPTVFLIFQHAQQIGRSLSGVKVDSYELSNGRFFIQLRSQDVTDHSNRAANRPEASLKLICP